MARWINKEIVIILLIYIFIYFYYSMTKIFGSSMETFLQTGLTISLVFLLKYFVLNIWKLIVGTKKRFINFLSLLNKIIFLNFRKLKDNFLTPRFHCHPIEPDSSVSWHCWAWLYTSTAVSFTPGGFCICNYLSRKSTIFEWDRIMKEQVSTILWHCPCKMD